MGYRILKGYHGAHYMFLSYYNFDTAPDVGPSDCYRIIFF